MGGPGLSATWGAPDYFRLFPVSADQGIGILLLKAIGCEQLGCGTDIGSGRDHFHIKHDPSCEIEVYIRLTCKASRVSSCAKDSGSMTVPSDEVGEHFEWAGQGAVHQA